MENSFLGLKNSLSKIKTNHGKTLQYQAMLRAFEAKDRSVMEHNYERVNFWSLVHLCAMVGTAMLQVDILDFKPLHFNFTQTSPWLPDLTLAPDFTLNSNLNRFQVYMLRSMFNTKQPMAKTKVST